MRTCTQPTGTAGRRIGARVILAELNERGWKVVR